MFTVLTPLRALVCSHNGICPLTPIGSPQLWRGIQWVAKEFGTKSRRLSRPLALMVSVIK